ncbi:MAG: glycoside hydrolase family 31 protein, partial [Bacteroidales bacterium]|nr:glycoside hydrolase family 31 protein [Bacteroidales bacterium]
MKKHSLVLMFALLIFAACNGRFSSNGYSYSVVDQTIKISSKERTFTLNVVNDSIVKVNYSKKGDIPSDSSFTVIYKPEENVEFSITETDTALIIKTKKLFMIAGKEPFHLVFRDADSNKELLVGKEFKLEDTDGFKLVFKASAQDKYFGMGQKSIPVDRRGYSFEVINKHFGGYTRPYANMQVNIPFIYTTYYAVYFDNPYTAYIDLAKEKQDEWYYKADGGQASFYLINITQPLFAARTYSLLTGATKLVPKWTLGLLQSKCTYANDNEVYKIVKTYRDKDLPLDGIILDLSWFGSFAEPTMSFGNYSWHQKNFPEPEKFLDSLKSMGVKVAVLNDPYINTTSFNFDKVAESGWLVGETDSGAPYVFEDFWAGPASLIDVSDPGLQKWIWGEFKKLINQGVDGLWLDLTEPEHPVKDGKFYLGNDKKVHNIYSNILAETVWNGYQKDFPDKRVFNLTRSGYAGIQRYGTFMWSGDASKTWNALKLQIPMLIGMAASGINNFASDIGGFTNTWDVTDGSTVFTNRVGDKVLTTGELYTRWFQFGTFSPMLRPHSGENQYCEVFAFDKETERITSDYLKLRYQMVPYIYSYMYTNYLFGEGLIKPMFFNYQEDKVYKFADYQYLFGNELLVAPVLDEGKKERHLYLPQLSDSLKWIYFWNDRGYSGGQEITVAAPLNEIPVFVKQGAIIPLSDVKRYIDEYPDTCLTIKIYAGGNAHFTLYEDDGKTN